MAIPRDHEGFRRLLVEGCAFAASGLPVTCVVIELPQKTFPACINKCSRIGPRLSAGKNVSALTIRTTELKRTVNSGVVTGNVPTDSGTTFFRARFPAIAKIGITTRKRPNSMLKPVVMLYQLVFAFSPAKADPLFAAVET